MRQSLIIAASILVAAAGLSIAQNDDPAPRLPAGAMASGGTLRYQMVIVSGKQSPTVVVCDTTSGHCWKKLFGQNDWDSLGRPPGAPAAAK